MARLEDFALSVTAQVEQVERSLDRAGRTPNGWRTVADLRVELRFPSDAACRAWLRREGIAGVRRGRVILIDSLDVDRALRNA